MREIDLTKVSLSPKSIGTLIVGIAIVLILIGVAAWLVNRGKGLVLGTKPAAPVASWG